MKGISTIALTLFALTVFGCASVKTVPESEGVKPINGFTMTCKNPYKFTQDCNIWSGAGRKVEIDGFLIDVAANESGDVVLVMDAKLIKNTILSNPLVLNTPRSSKAVNSSFDVVRDLFHESGIKIDKVIPVKIMGDIKGYVIELNGDGYTLLKNFTKTS